MNQLLRKSFFSNNQLLYTREDAQENTSGKELFTVFENVAHSSDDMPCDDLVSYFIANISEVFST
jgi:hypothetical protein